MESLVRKLLLLILVSTIVVAGCGFIRTRPVRYQPVDAWEPLLFGGSGERKQGYDTYVNLMKLKPLREELKYSDEIEIRFWRGVFLTDTEMVALRFKEGKWTAIHAIPEDIANLTQIRVKALPVPRGGWTFFYNKLVELGIYEAQTESEERCRDGIDGKLNLVEISKDNVYRNAINQSRYENCDNSRKMALIAEHIAISFDDEKAECKRYEWFPCAKIVRERRLEEESKAK